MTKTIMITGASAGIGKATAQAWINMSSVGGKVAFPLGTLYHGTKFAVEGLSEALSYELAPFGVRVKIIEPGVVDTDFGGRSFAFSNDESLAEYQPLVQKLTEGAASAVTSAQGQARGLAKVIFTAARGAAYELKPASRTDVRATDWVQRTRVLLGNSVVKSSILPSNRHPSVASRSSPATRSSTRSRTTARREMQRMSFTPPVWVRRAAAAALVVTCAACAPNAARGPIRIPDEPAPLAPAPPGAIKRVVLVSVDGMMPDTYLHPDAHGLRVPTMRWLLRHGAVSEGVESVFPTLTYPSHTSMVTGVNPGKHGIVSNGSFDPLENDLESWRWYAEDIKAEPVWRIAQRAGYATALVHWPVTLGAQVKWLLPEFWRAKNVQDQKLLRVVATPGLLDAVAREQPDFWNRYVPPNVSDDSLTDVAIHILRHGRPRLLLLHLVGVDGAQHRHGLDSPEARAAIETDDRQIARIFGALSEAGLSRETAVMVVSDHGFRAAGKMVRPCALLRDAGLVTLSSMGKIGSWKATVLSNAGQAYVYVQDPADYVTRETVRAIFAARREDPASGIGRVYEADEVRARGGDPAAFLALEAANDFQFGAGCTGDYSGPPQYVATHGFDPERPEMRASLLMAGPGIAHGTVSGAHLIDVGPTIAAWLGLEMPNVDGKPFRITPAPN